MKREEIFLNHEHKVFTVTHPKNTFIIDYSSGGPCIITTNVTKHTKWSDIFKGNYDYANPDGTPGYILVNGIKYTYIDGKYAAKIGYQFTSVSNTDVIEKYKSKLQKKAEHFFRKSLP